MIMIIKLFIKIIIKIMKFKSILNQKNNNSDIKNIKHENND